MILLILSASPALALRCGNDLINIGDTTMGVMVTLKNNGGEILLKEDLGGKSNGYISSRAKGHQTPKGSYVVRSKTSYDSKTELIQKWYIKAPAGYGNPYCYELTFVGSVLNEIGDGVECK